MGDFYSLEEKKSESFSPCDHIPLFFFSKTKKMSDMNVCSWQQRWSRMAYFGVLQASGWFSPTRCSELRSEEFQPRCREENAPVVENIYVYFRKELCVWNIHQLDIKKIISCRWWFFFSWPSWCKELHHQFWHFWRNTFLRNHQDINEYEKHMRLFPGIRGLLHLLLFELL